MIIFKFQRGGGIPVRNLFRSQVPPIFLLLAVWKSGRGPGIFYRVSDVEGREKVERT